VDRRGATPTQGDRTRVRSPVASGMASSVLDNAIAGTTFSRNSEPRRTLALISPLGRDPSPVKRKRSRRADGRLISAITSLRRILRSAFATSFCRYGEDHSATIWRITGVIAASFRTPEQTSITCLKKRGCEIRPIGLTVEVVKHRESPCMGHLEGRSPAPGSTNISGSVEVPIRALNHAGVRDCAIIAYPAFAEVMHGCELSLQTDFVDCTAVLRAPIIGCAIQVSILTLCQQGLRNRAIVASAGCAETI
jgi:hypothetical protein